MALSSRLKLWEQKIKEKKEEPTSPPPPLSALPGGFLKQLVRETEKETKQKEPEVKEEKVPSKLSDNLVQQFLLPDQTPPILEAEMALRNEHLVNGERGRHSNQSDLKTSSPPQIISPEIKSPPLGDTAKKEETSEPQKQEMTTEQLKQKQEVTSELQGQEVKSGKEKVTNDAKKSKMEGKKEKQKEEKKEGVIEERLEPEGQQADTTLTQHTKKEVRDVWYEIGTVWYVHKEGFSLATQLKPDEGTPDLPAGLVRVRMETDGTLHDVMEHDIHKLNPSELDLCEDLSELQSVNECGALHTLTSRAKASLPLTQAGPNLLNFWPPLNQHGKTPRSRRGDSVWDAPPALAALVRRVYVSMVGTRRDQSVCAVGRSGTGKTTSCQAFTHTLLKQAGTAGDSISVERIQAVFTILRSFGCVSSQHSDASSRFAMVLSLDFNHAGLASAGHLQTMMLEKWRVCQKMEGESNFLVFSQMLAGLSTEMRTELQMHQFPEANCFGIVPPTKVEEKQRASVAFTKLLVAMETLGFSANEQRAIWHVLAGLYHLGAAGACKVGRRAFVSFDSAQVASSVLGCEGEELHTAVFKHHLRQLLQRATGGGRERHATTDAEEGPRMSATQCVDGMASGLYEELFTAIVSLINRALSSQQLTLASVMVVDTPGLRNPRHSAEERAAGWSELCHNYLQERLLEYYYTHTFTHTLERYAQDGVQVDFEAPETSPAEVVSSIDQPALQVRGAEGDPRGLLWVLDEEMVTPGSTENTVLERVCQYYSSTVRKCEQPLQCEVSHLMGSDPVRYDLTGWFSLVQNNPSALNAISLLQNSSVGVVKALFGPRASVPPLCRGLGGVEGGSQRSLQRSGTVRKTFSGGMAAIRRHSHCISVKLQADALLNLIRRARPVFLQCVGAKTDSGCGGFDVPALRIQLHSTHILPALQLYRTVLTCIAMLPPYLPLLSLHSLSVSPSFYPSSHQVFMKRGVLKYLDQQRDKLVSVWLVHLQAACMGHLARQQHRKMKASLTPDPESLAVHLRFEMEMERMKQIHLKELEDKEEELEDVHKSSQRRLRQLEMQLEQEYEEKQMVVHEKHDLEGLIATLCDQVGHRDFDVEKRLRRDLKRTHALLVDAQLLLSTIDNPGHSQAPGSKEHIERLHCQLEESEARRAEVESVQKTLSMELENAQIELENICKHKSLVDEQVAQLQHDKSDLLKRLEEDQEDLNELMKKHKALIAQSSSDISQIRELQAELEEAKKQQHTLQEELATSMARVQFLESSTVGRSIVSMQEARVCDLENKLEFQRGQVKRFEVLVLRLRDSVVRLGEELEQSAQTEVRERENSQYYQQRLHHMRQEVEDLSQREQDSSRRCLELEMQVTELSAVRQTLQADLETSIHRIVDLQAALEEVESSDESDDESVATAVESFAKKRDLDSVSSVGSQSLGTEDVGEGIRHWLGVPRGGARRGSPYGSSTISNQSGRQSVTDTMSTYSFRSCVDPDENGLEPGGVVGNGGSSHLGRASSSSALSELLEGLRKRRGGAESGEGDGSTISLPIYQTTGASTLRRRASALSLGPEDLQEPRSILKPPSPLLPRAASLRNIGEPQASSAASRDSGAKRYNSSDSLSSLPSLPLLSSLTSPTAPRRRPPTISIPEEDSEEPFRSLCSPQRSPQPMRRRLLESVVSEGGGEGCLGSEPMVFQNRRLISDGNRDDAASDILPAIRRAQSTSSLASSVRGGRRALSVHFGELPPSTRSRKGSDSSSTSSGSGGSSQGGGVRRSGGGGPQGERLDAEGSEGGDVASVMKKYLRKSEDLRKSEID
ncbi:unconventional myosin-XVIIIb [Oncorhynchus kisutch]|uniref:unconventional myosin-XVIIIb n=1 Tax=Oncorhynchus kisutch TaxID=8019 RepID=UPI0012DF4ED1|nr:unconventional myosin-XVIIIb-like [Oncorhynchus kisutch]